MFSQSIVSSIQHQMAKGKKEIETETQREKERERGSPILENAKTQLPQSTTRSYIIPMEKASSYHSLSLTQLISHITSRSARFSSCADFATEPPLL